MYCILFHSISARGITNDTSTEAVPLDNTAVQGAYWRKSLRLSKMLKIRTSSVLGNSTDYQNPISDVVHHAELQYNPT